MPGARSENQGVDYQGAGRWIVIFETARAEAVGNSVPVTEVERLRYQHFENHIDHTQVGAVVRHDALSLSMRVLQLNAAAGRDG
jgi:hypothetical protein